MTRNRMESKKYDKDTIIGNAVMSSVLVRKVFKNSCIYTVISYAPKKCERLIYRNKLTNGLMGNYQV